MEIHALSTKKIHFQFRNSLIVAQDAFLRVPREILESFFSKWWIMNPMKKLLTSTPMGNVFIFKAFGHCIYFATRTILLINIHQIFLGDQSRKYITFMHMIFALQNHIFISEIFYMCTRGFGKLEQILT